MPLPSFFPTPADGTKGIECIKEYGGYVIVQDPATAKFDGMPNSAITSGCSDQILPPELMAEEIFRFPELTHKQKEGKLLLQDTDAEHLKEIITIVREQTSHDFSSYKEQTLHRRIMRRIAQVDIDTAKEYIHFLRNNPDEVRYLGKEFLIGVTRFFRDPEAFEVLEDKVLADILSKKSFEDPLKIWITACSTGEEAYTMAMLVSEELQKLNKQIDVKIFATDIDSSALEFAAKGVYPDTIEKDVSPERLEKFFTREGKKYCVNQKIRRMVIFAQHNVIKDPPFSKMDLVSCRNMLIYMKPSLQRKVLATFHFSLRVAGYLFLGPSETGDEMLPALKVVNKKWNIFKVISKSSNFIFDGNVMDKERVHSHRVPDVQPKRRSSEQEMQESFHELVTEELGFAAVFINEEFELQQAMGDYKRFLEMPDKVLHNNLLKMVPRELSLALRKSMRDNEKVAAKRIEILRNGMLYHISLVVKPFLAADQYSRKFITVLFKEESAEKITPGERAIFEQQVSIERLIELENELKQTKYDLQTMVEELETSNEEMQSSNEELISSNEELQSTNEELQSVNEELHTVNAEHQQKIRQLKELNDDLNNYFRSTDIGQIFVDKQLIIRKFIPGVKHQINLIDSEIGRPINHLSYNIRSENLIEDIKAVIKTSKVVQKEIETRNGKFYLMKILPYLRHDKSVDGAVVSFVDISLVKELNNLLEGVLNSSTSGIMAFAPVMEDQHKLVDFEWTLINKSCKTIFKREGEELEGKRPLQQLPGFKKDGLFKKLQAVYTTRKSLHLEHKYHHDGLDAWLEIIAVPLDAGIAVTVIVISEKKAAEEELLATYDDVKDAEEKLRKLNLELEKRVINRTKELSDSEERFRLLSRATNDAVWDWDLVRSDFWWNEGFQEVLNDVESDIRTEILVTAAFIETDFQVPKLKYNRVNLQSIIYNLLSNALKYKAHDQSPYVRIATERKDGHILLTFSDNGLGMSAQQQKKLLSK